MTGSLPARDTDPHRLPSGDPDAPAPVPHVVSVAVVDERGAASCGPDDCTRPAERTGPDARITMGERVTALAEVILCSGVPTQIGVGAVLLAIGMRPFDESGRLAANYVVVLSLADTALLLGMVWGFLRFHDERPIEVIAGRRPWLRDVVLALPVLVLVGIAVVAVLLAVRTWAPWLHNVARNPFEDLIHDRASAIALGVAAVIGGGLREEAQRAFVLHRFDRYLGGGRLGLVLFSVAFGAGHAIQGWDVAIATGVMGTIWGAVFLARRSAVAPMVSHALFNASEVFRYTSYGL